MRLFFADTEASFYVTEYDGDDGPLGKETIRPGQHDGAHKDKVDGDESSDDSSADDTDDSDDGDDGPLGQETIRPGQHDGAHKGKVQGRAEGMEDGKKARGSRVQCPNAVPQFIQWKEDF